MKGRELPTRQGERGAAVIMIAAACLAVMLVAGSIGLSFARQDLYRAMIFAKRTNALMTAEAALEDSAIHLDEIQSWATIPLPHDEFVGFQALGHGYYQARLLNNATDESAVDSDKALRILGKGYSHNRDITVTLEGMYRRIAFDLDPPAVVTICGNDYYYGLSGSSYISGYNHYLPPSPCSGSACNPVADSSPLDKGGVSFERAGREVMLSSPSVLEGSPPESSGDPALQGDTGFCAQARLISEFMYRLPMPERISEWPVNSQEVYGTVSDPKLLYVAKGTELDLNGTTQGFGVLLIDGRVVQTGTFTFSGLIVIGRNAEIVFKGTVNLFGAVVSAGGYPYDPAWVYTPGGNVKMVHSAEALQALHGVTMPGLWYSWREYKGPEEPYPTIGL